MAIFQTENPRPTDVHIVSMHNDVADGEVDFYVDNELVFTLTSNGRLLRYASLDNLGLELDCDGCIVLEE